jgi:hypothetical protein
MREAKANLAVNKLLKDVAKKFDADKAIIQLAEIRVLALEEEDPTVVKICTTDTVTFPGAGNANTLYSTI